MRYYLDCEYDGFGGELISFALVPEDGGEELYLVIKHDRSFNDWVERHVVPYLWTVPDQHRHDPLDRVAAAELLSSWLAGLRAVEIIADWPDDLALFARLLTTSNGQMVAMPALTLRLVRLPGFSTARNSAVPHNALHDARSLRDHLSQLDI
jgi:hypothetical protein